MKSIIFLTMLLSVYSNPSNACGPEVVHYENPYILSRVIYSCRKLPKEITAIMLKDDTIYAHKLILGSRLEGKVHGWCVDERGWHEFKSTREDYITAGFAACEEEK